MPCQIYIYIFIIYIYIYIYIIVQINSDVTLSKQENGGLMLYLFDIPPCLRTIAMTTHKHIAYCGYNYVINCNQTSLSS